MAAGNAHDKYKKAGLPIEFQTVILSNRVHVRGRVCWRTAVEANAVLVNTASGQSLEK